MRGSEICVKQICVNQGLSVINFSFGKIIKYLMDSFEHANQAEEESVWA